jgi:hypothetical protein
MKMSKTKFIMLFLISGFVFQFISNSLLGSEVRLFPVNGEYFPGTGSPIAWKSIMSTILYPVKLVLLGPLLSLFELPDPPPPLLVIAFALYWALLALMLYYVLDKIYTLKKM